MNKFTKNALLSATSMLLVTSISAQETQEERYIAPSNHPDNVYFGDAHVHTVMSMDAAAWGTTQTPDDSYRYAKGEEVTSYVLKRRSETIH